MKYPDDAEKTRLHFLWLFSFWVPHYTKGACEEDCPCNCAPTYDASQECYDDGAEEKSDATVEVKPKRSCLDPLTDAHEIEELIKLHATLASGVEEFVSGFSTTHVESHNAAAKVLAPKRIHYYKSWGSRTLVAAIKSHIGDNILVRLCEKLQIPMTAPVKQEIGKMTQHAENAATHKATENYMKMKAQGRKISMGVRELEKAWSVVHGKDSYDGEKTIDYSGLSAASTLELGLGAVLPSSRAKAMNPADVAKMVRCPICNDRSMLPTSMKSHMKSQKHVTAAAAAAARGQTCASPTETPVQAQAQSQPTVIVDVSTPVSIAVPTPEPVSTPAHVRLATGSSHNAIVESAAFQAAMANFNATRLADLRLQNNEALSEELAALKADI